MKTRMLLVLTICSLELFAQGNNPNHSGIYLTSADFLANKLAYEIDCNTSSHKIILHNFLSKPHMEIIHEGEKHTLQKKDLYAFRDCENQLFRFYNNEELLIKEINTLYIYVINKPVPAGKRVETKEVYYFSVGVNGEIQLLTKENLKKAFPNNHKFHDSLDAFFKDDTDISLYDSFHKMHKINHLLNESLK